MTIQDRVVDYAVGQVRGRFVPSDEERAAAYELLVELLSRSTTQPITNSEGSIRDSLTSMHELFDVTREVLRAHGPRTARGTSGNVSLGMIALRVLNEELRPVLTRWHIELQHHEARRPATSALSTVEWEREWPMALECRAALTQTRRKVIAYVDTLGQIAGTQSLAAAVIAGPASHTFTPHRLDRRITPPPGFVPRQQMVRWLAPGEMIKTLLSRRHAQPGLERHRTTPPPDGDVHPTHDFAEVEQDDFWFDYVADTGDAFDGVAPIAWLIGRERIAIPPDASRGLPLPPPFLPRGELLILGGDQVYPYATAAGYRNQIEIPFQMCFEHPHAESGSGSGRVDDDRPVMVAIPGNHDWLGGIEHFEHTFTTQRPDPFAGAWKVVQDQRWWHLRLPHGWWVWGIDTALDNTIPAGEAEYFRRAAAGLQAGDRVMLCSPVPLWQLLQKFPDRYRAIRETLVPLIFERQARLAVCVSGDSHYFAHFERRDGIEEDHITAGGGGAFLQPTHTIPERIPTELGRAEFTNTARWPLPADSRRLAPASLPLRDPQTWVVAAGMAALHALFALVVSIRAVELPWTSDEPGLSGATRWTLASPWALVMLAATAGAGIVAVAANSREKLLRRAAKGHGLALGFGVAATLAVIAVVRRTLDWGPAWAQILIASSIGGLLTTALFFGGVNLINRQIRAAETLAYSRAHSTRFKHFLRFRIDATGDLTCFAIGIDPAGVGWYDALTKYESVPPDDPAGTPRIHYVWGKTYPHPVRPLRIAVSISDPDGVDPQSSESVFVAVCTSLIQAGHTLLYGGRPSDGYTALLARIEAERFANTPVSRAHLVNYVADYLWSGDPADDESYDGIMRSVRVRRAGATARVSDEVRAADAVGDLTAMRQRMLEDSDVRVVIGGQLEPRPNRVAPGIIEEAFLSVDAGQPLIVAGGFGGSSALLAKLILGDPSGDAASLVASLSGQFMKPGSGPDFLEMTSRFSPATELANGLTLAEQQSVLTSPDPRSVARLILRSVDLIGRSLPPR